MAIIRRYHVGHKCSAAASYFHSHFTAAAAEYFPFVFHARICINLIDRLRTAPQSVSRSLLHFSLSITGLN